MLAVLIGVCFVCQTLPGLARTGAPMPHILPADPQATVIEWRSVGGQAEPAFDSDLIVHANGEVTVGSRLTGGRPVEDRIPAPQLQELLSFAIDENGFFAIQAEQVESQIEASRPAGADVGAAGEALAVPTGPPYLDAGTTVLIVAADGRRHEVRQQGLFAAAREHPEIQALAQLRAIELRLLELAQQIAAGGE
jgi:hypothetical protein